MKAWLSVKENKNLAKLNDGAVKGVVPKQELKKNITINDSQDKEKAARKLYADGLYGAFRTFIKTGKSVGEALGPVGSALGIICTFADTMLENMEKLEDNNTIVAQLSGRIKRQLPTLQALKKHLEQPKDGNTATQAAQAAQLLPHIENLGEVYIEVHEKIMEWSGQSKASKIMRMLGAQEYWKDFWHLEVIVTSCMTDLGTAITTMGLLVDVPPPVDKDQLQDEVKDAIRQDLQMVMREVMDAEANGVVGPELEQRASRVFIEYGLDFKEMKRKERKRWRADKLRDLFIPFQELTVLSEVGKSACTRVLRCTWQRHTVAFKEAFNMPPDQLKEIVEREGYIMSLLRHPNIIQIFGIVSEDGRPDVTLPPAQQTRRERHYGLVLEFHGNGSLQTLIEQAHEKGEDTLPVKRRVELALQIARGMAYLHGRSLQPIVHGNLKPTNILIANNGRAVITDFGSATLSNSTTTTMAGPQASNFSAGGVVAVYTAPEVTQLLLDNKKFPPTVDVFSFGILMFELMTLQPAYKGFANDTMEYSRKMDQGARPAIPPELPPVLAFCINMCWAQDPTKRPAFNFVVDMLNAVAASLM